MVKFCPRIKNRLPDYGVLWARVRRKTVSLLCERRSKRCRISATLFSALVVATLANHHSVRTKGRWFYRGEGGRTRTVAQVHIYSHTIHKYSHTIRTLFATIRTLFAHYSRTIRAGSHRFTSVHAGSRRFTQVQAWFAQYQTMFALSALFAGIHTIRKVFALFAQYIRKYSRGIRTVFAQYSRTFAHVRTSVADRSHSIRNYSQPFTPSRIGKHL